MNKLTVMLTKVLVTAVMLMSSVEVAHAYETAKLQVDVSGAQKDKYYICLSSVGCLRIDGTNETIPIDPTEVRYIFVANTATYQMYPQSLPDSCHVTVNGNQKLVVKGNLAKAANDKMYIANLHCAVS